MFMCSMLTPVYRFIAVHMVIAAPLSCLHRYPHAPFFVLFSDSTHISWRWRMVIPELCSSSSGHSIPFIVHHHHQCMSLTYQAMALNPTIHALKLNLATCL